MNNMPTVRWLLKALINPGWAPLAVVIIHVGLAEYGLTDRFDHHLHFMGGAAIAYFLHGIIPKLPPALTIHSKWIHYLLAFTSACTVALFWEFAEFTSDRVMRTTIQHSLNETILDLVFGVTGAFLSLLLIAVVTRLLKNKEISAVK